MILNLDLDLYCIKLHLDDVLKVLMVWVEFLCRNLSINTKEEDSLKKYDD